MRRLTTEEFISRAAAILGDNYNLSSVIYTSAKAPIQVICKTHSPFMTTPDAILAGKACPECAKAKRGEVERRRSAAEFASKVQEVHGDKYDCSNSAYVSYTTSLDVLCRAHQQIFTTKPRYILAGHGCPLCAREQTASEATRTTAEFINIAKDIFGEIYDYSKVEYKHSREKVLLTCADHGNFSVTPSNHIHNGIGCPKCVRNGYNEAKAGSVYVLSYDDLTKVGITNLSPCARIANIKNECGKQFVTLYEHRFENGTLAKMVEGALLSELRSQYKNPIKEFVGYTETFIDVDRARLLSRIEQLIKEFTNDS